MHFQKMLVLFPVHICLKINSPAVRIEMNVLAYQGAADSALQHKRDAHRPGLAPFHGFQPVCIPEFFCIININVPVIIINRLVFVHAHQVCPRTLLQHFPVVFFIVNPGKHALFIQLNAIKRCFQHPLPGQHKRNFRLLCLFHLRKGTVTLWRQVFHINDRAVFCLLHRIKVALAVLQRLRIQAARIKEHDIAAGASGCIKQRHAVPVSCNCLHPLAGQLSDSGICGFVFLSGHFIDFLNARAWQDIMELV